MDNNTEHVTPEQDIADLGHLAWCALVALRLAQQEGKAQSSLTVHSFMTGWLAAAQKQRRFPRSVAVELDILLRLGRQKGPAAKLLQRLEYLCESCAAPVAMQSDLFRLTNVIESLKKQGWINAAVSDDDWVPEVLLAEYADTPALLVRKAELMDYFTADGRLLHPLTFLVNGDVNHVAESLGTCGLCCEETSSPSEYSVLRLMPSNIPPSA